MMIIVPTSRSVPTRVLSEASLPYTNKQIASLVRSLRLPSLVYPLFAGAFLSLPLIPSSD